MKVFVTGGTGFIGRSVVEQLKLAGHEVSGLARSDESADKLSAVGVQPIRGNLKEPAGCLEAATAADATIHAAMEYDAATAETDRDFVNAVAGAYVNTGKTLVYTSGVWVHGDTGGAYAKEGDHLNPPPVVAWRPAVEQIALDAAGKGVRSIVVRPGMVYGRGGGAGDRLKASGKTDGVVRFIGNGENYWALVHVDDLAGLYVLALEKAPNGVIFLAVSGESVTVRQIAEAAAGAIGIPGRVEAWPADQAREAMGPMVDALVMSQRASALRAETLLGWKHVGPSVLTDLAG